MEIDFTTIHVVGKVTTCDLEEGVVAPYETKLQVDEMIEALVALPEIVRALNIQNVHLSNIVSLLRSSGLNGTNRAADYELDTGQDTTDSYTGDDTNKGKPVTVTVYPYGLQDNFTYKAFANGDEGTTNLKNGEPWTVETTIGNTLNITVLHNQLLTRNTVTMVVEAALNPEWDAKTNNKIWLVFDGKTMTFKNEKDDPTTLYGQEPTSEQLDELNKAIKKEKADSWFKDQQRDYQASMVDEGTAEEEGSESGGSSSGSGSGSSSSGKPPKNWEDCGDGVWYDDQQCSNSGNCKLIVKEESDKGLHLNKPYIRLGDSDKTTYKFGTTLYVRPYHEITILTTEVLDSKGRVVEGNRRWVLTIPVNLKATGTNYLYVGWKMENGKEKFKYRWA